MSTWSQDVARGLDHPDSVAGRKERIVAHSKSETERLQSFNHGLRILASTLRNESELVTLLSVASSALASASVMPGSDMAENIELLDELADKIQYRYEGEQA